MDEALAFCTEYQGSIPVVAKSAKFRLFSISRVEVVEENRTWHDEKALLSASRIKRTITLVMPSTFEVVRVLGLAKILSWLGHLPKRRLYHHLEWNKCCKDFVSQTHSWLKRMRLKINRNGLRRWQREVLTTRMRFCFKQKRKHLRLSAYEEFGRQSRYYTSTIWH